MTPYPTTKPTVANVSRISTWRSGMTRHCWRWLDRHLNIWREKPHNLFMCVCVCVCVCDVRACVRACVHAVRAFTCVRARVRKCACYLRLCMFGSCKSSNNVISLKLCAVLLFITLNETTDLWTCVRACVCVCVWLLQKKVITNKASVWSCVLFSCSPHLQCYFKRNHGFVKSVPPLILQAFLGYFPIWSSECCAVLSSSPLSRPCFDWNHGSVSSDTPAILQAFPQVLSS